jgi:DNA repair ATPase RecN
VSYQDIIKAKRDQTTQTKQEQAQRDELAQTVIRAITDKGIKLEAQVDTKTDEAELAALKDVQTAIEKLQALESDGNSSTNKLLSDVLRAVRAIVPAQKQPIDFKPLQDTIKQYFDTNDTDTLDLDDYKAQDLSDGDNIQYVGFLNPAGKWYIIENDLKKNTLRYVFGSGKYSDAFKKAASYDYKLLNEAVNATA